VRLGGFQLEGKEEEGGKKEGGMRDRIITTFDYMRNFE
jgi:hypothetical protein